MIRRRGCVRSALRGAGVRGAGLGLVLALAVTACSGPARLAAPARVPVTLAPAGITGGLTLSEYSGDRKAFAQAGRDSLVTDGRLWEIHLGHLLVGTLEIATVTNDVTLASSGDRSQILNGAMVGAVPVSIHVSGVGVAVASAPERTLYVWFGREVFEVLQLDDQRVDPEAVLTAIINSQQTTGLLHPEPLPSLT